MTTTNIANRLTKKIFTYPTFSIERVVKNYSAKEKIIFKYEYFLYKNGQLIEVFFSLIKARNYFEK